MADFYERKEVLGEGTFGTVFRACRKRDGVVVAVKRMKVKDDSFGLDFTAIREVKYLRELHHPNIIKVITYFLHHIHCDLNS
jgi:cyclin-dependent kinase 7